MPIEIVLFGPSARGRPSPTFVKPGVEGTQSPTRGFKRGAICHPLQTRHEWDRIHWQTQSKRGRGKFSCRLKSSFLGLRPEVGLRRPLSNRGWRGPSPLQGGLRVASYHPLQTHHEWDRIHWQTQSKRGEGKFSCRLKSSFLGLWPEVGLRRP